MLSAREVAKALSVSINWVYRHKDALRGFQPAPGCALAFSETIIQQIQEGAYGIPTQGRTLAGGTDDRRTAQDEDLPHESGGKKMGGRAKRRPVAGPDKYRLLA